MDSISTNLLYLLARYIHIVCTTLLVGGTLFYEMVVPIAIDDLKTELQLSVFARARWVFRWIVWGSIFLLLASGIITATGPSHWPAYQNDIATSILTAGASAQPAMDRVPGPMQPGWWFAAHTAAGLIAMVIALFLTLGRRPPERPVTWMRMNLVVLLIVMFLGAAARQARIMLAQKAAASGFPQMSTQ
jgi:peptidoglycan/LPS O-acetylase OafA/YrhL